MAQRQTRAASEEGGGAEDAEADNGSVFFGPSDADPPPQLGEVFLSETHILHALEGRDIPDRKDERPVVVVREPTRAYPRVNVCVRQSMKRGQKTPPGVPHAADPRLKLTLAGVWLPGVKFAHVEAFAGEAVEYRGVLEEGVFKRVQEMVARGRP